MTAPTQAVKRKPGKLANLSSKSQLRATRRIMPKMHRRRIHLSSLPKVCPFCGPSVRIN